MCLEAYVAAQHQYPGVIALFKFGDFYEAYGENAELLARDLHLAVTTRTDPITGKKFAMVGFPHHVLETQLSRLLQAGHRVAICNLEADPARRPSQPTFFDIDLSKE